MCNVVNLQVIDDRKALASGSHPVLNLKFGLKPHHWKKKAYIILLKFFSLRASTAKLKPFFFQNLSFAIGYILITYTDNYLHVIVK